MLKMCTYFVGILTCHSTLAVITWRQVNWLIVIPSVFGILATLTWPESPSWLAFQERYDECRKSFAWVRGDGAEAKKEVQELITAQKELRKLNSDYNNFRGIVNAFRKKQFLKPFSVVLTIAVVAQASGHHFMLAFVIDIMTKLTGDSSKAYYFTLVFDSMKIVSGLSSSVLIRLLKRRTMVIFSGSSLCFFMAMICLCNYLVSKSVISATWLVPTLLILFNAMCHIGIIPLSIVLLAEVFPLQYRGLGASVNGVIFCILSTVALKVTPTMLDNLDVHGTFSIYLVIATCGVVCLFFILPETKDRTLQNIELEIMNVKIKFDDEDDVDKPLKDIEGAKKRTEYENK